MPSITDGGIRIFSASSKDALEDQINTFLVGTGATENKKKVIIQPPTLMIDSGIFYSLITYKTTNS